MIKLLIADDEKTIRETISSLIDWESMGIEVVGLCQNGLEAYNMIVDVGPDIVLTDLKMPGMDGLELIEKIYESDRNTQFIILSGYGEFEYAKKAMSFGVREYLLKPCNEAQIVKAIKSCLEVRAHGLLLPKNPSGILDNIVSNILLNVINDSVSEQRSIEDIKSSYSSYLDFTYTPYRIVYIYYLTDEDRDSFLSDLRDYCSRNFPSLSVNGIYVKNTLLLIYKDYDIGLDALLDNIHNWHKDTLEVQLETKDVLYPDLASLLEPLTTRIRRYDDIYFINDFRAMYICNYQTHITNTESIIEDVKSGSFDSLENALAKISNTEFLRQLCSTLLLKLSLSSADITSSYLTDALKGLSDLEDIGEIKEYTSGKLRDIVAEINRNRNESQMTRQIKNYVNDNLSNPQITLKYISENVLFMNVDYVSKKFVKETGVRFSAYLSDLRINRAKDMLLSGEYSRMQDVAEAVGLGNNPQYFSQLFKKVTGKTPSSFLSDRAE